MKRVTRAIAVAVILVAGLAGVSCVEEGIGVSVPTNGARWSGPGDGPDVLVGGGPAY
jgi:hypothetical protein